MGLTYRQKQIQQHNREVASQSSWLCKLFNDADLNKKEKQEIIRRTINNYKKTNV